MTVTGEQTQEINQPDPNLLHQVEAPGYRFSLYLAAEKMECRADFCFLEDAAEVEAEAAEKKDPSATLPVITAPELIALLERKGITGIDFEALYSFCQAVEERVDQQGALLARGKEPETGADGWFELLVKTTGEEAAFEEDESGYVDLRTRHAFTEIEAGQKIGILHQPGEGIPGQTVNSLPILAERGKIYSLVAGEGVELKYDGRVAFAEKEGRALLERQVLSVVDQLVVSGDLDLQVGNIDFNGFVEVKGDVLDEFHIKASKGIKVGGVVGACHLETAGPVEIGSMAGKEVGEIICHGDLVAGFLNQVSVQCHGNVLVKNEIRNSVIKSTGCIIVERGSIVGGSCVALEGIEAKGLGATSCPLTLLTAGIYFPDADRFSFLRTSLKNIDEQIKRLKAAIGPLEKLTGIDEVTAKRLAILTEQWEKLEVERDDFNAELAASTKQEQATNNPKINVGSELHEGVQIFLGDASKKFKIERKGPMSIIENSKDGGFRYLSMTSLQKTAVELEEEILREEELAAEKAAAAVAAAQDEIGGGQTED